MEFKRIELPDKKTFNDHLAGREYHNMLYNFTSLFIWQDWEPFSWTEVDGAICIKSNYYNQDTVLAPFSPDDTCILKATEQLISWYKARGAGFIMTGVTQGHLDLYENSWPGRFDIKALPDEENYLYFTRALADLPGAEYRSKRNHVHRFIREYPDYRFVPLSTTLIPGCKENLDRWLDTRDSGDLNLLGEYQGINLALDNFGDLDYIGACLTVKDKVIAFTLGEELTPDTMGIHVEKADTTYHGSFAAINQFFARDYCRNYTYINRAEDMGIKGLRTAKVSYHPCRMEKVFQLRLKEK